MVSTSSERPPKPRLAFLRIGLRAMLRGQISPRVALLEYFQRQRVATRRRRERRILDTLNSQPARLLPGFQNLSSLLTHFRDRDNPTFFAGFEAAFKSTAEVQRRLFPAETKQLNESARVITSAHRWPLMGFGPIEFGDPIDWNRDPLSGRAWPLEFHADIALAHDDGSDVRVLWELNRLGHFITLARAYALSKNEVFAEEFFTQLAAWRQQNPVGIGANWSSAMEVALRAMNLLAAFMIFRRAPSLNEQRLSLVLSMLDQHGAHIQRNLEFSHVVTTNHYLSDLTGLLWLGIMLPELSAAKQWRDWALAELLREMDKQILPDGADYEASTGYHRLVTELFLYSFILCEANGISIEDKYREKLHLMLKFIRGILRPDGFAPLIGDADGGQVMPIGGRAANDQAYLLALGCVVYRDPKLKIPDLKACEELLWTLGEKGVHQYDDLPSEATSFSQAFTNSGVYVMREGDLFLIFNAGGPGALAYGSHGHNDALSIEVAACGRAFIVDPGVYVYNANLHQRHLFRSTAYHSTVQIDDQEQNTIHEHSPFVIGAEGQARVMHWETGSERDTVIGEHSGYARLPAPVRHRRKIVFEKTERWWLVEDEFLGTGRHQIATRFHFDAGLVVQQHQTENIAVGLDEKTEAQMLVCAIDLRDQPEFEQQASSKNYGSRLPSISATWVSTTTVPYKLRWAIIPVRAGENESERLKVIAGLRLSA